METHSVPEPPTTSTSGGPPLHAWPLVFGAISLTLVVQLSLAPWLPHAWQRAIGLALPLNVLSLASYRHARRTLALPTPAWRVPIGQAVFAWLAAIGVYVVLGWRA